MYNGYTTYIDEYLALAEGSYEKGIKKVWEDWFLTTETKQESLSAFLQRQKNDFKKIRKILDAESINQSQASTLRIVESCARITGTTVPNENTLNNVLSVWNLFCFGNDFREFLYKHRNNYLGVGARVAHFDDDTDEHCTFCRILYPATRTREDFLHIFRMCPITVGLIQNPIRNFCLPIPLPDSNLDPE